MSYSREGEPGMSQTEDSVTNWGFWFQSGQERKETQRPPFETKLLPIQTSENMTGDRTAFQTHTHKHRTKRKKRKTYESHHKDTVIIKTCDYGQKRDANK